MRTSYCKCGEEFDQDCQGRQRCPSCDPPCPDCYDGGMDDDDGYAEEMHRQASAEAAAERFNEYRLEGIPDGPDDPDPEFPW